MKLASLPDGSRDGRLVVVSRDLTVCSDAHHIAPSLAAALAGWEAAAPELDLIARGVESLGQPLERFHERAARAPLPHAGEEGFDDPRSPLRTGAAVTAEIGLAFLGDDAGPARLLALFADFGPAGRTLSPVAVTDDEAAPGTLSIRVTGQAPVRLDLPLAPPRIATDAGGVLRLAPVAALTLRPGDGLRVEHCDAARRSVFGAIERAVEAKGARTDAATTGTVTALDHVLLAIPAGSEDLCRPFYTDLLGFAEVVRPAGLAARPGAWFATAGAELHIGVDPDFRPAAKAHPALRVSDLDGLAARLAAAGHPVRHDDAIAGRRRLFTEDPVGNRIELIAADAP